MSAIPLLSYAIALLIAVATPGPAMLAVIARSLANGTNAGIAVGTGVATADVILGAFAFLGLATIMAAMSWLLVAVKFAGAAYLIILGIRMWKSSTIADPSDTSTRSSNFLLGLSVALSNPKAILFHASLMPLIVDLSSLDLSDGLAILGIIFLVNLLVMGAYAWLAGRNSANFGTAQRMRLLNQVGGGSLIGAAALVVAR